MTVNRVLVLSIVLVVILIIGIFAVDTMQKVNLVTATIEVVLTETSMTRTAIP